MKTHDEMVQAWMEDPAFASEYDALKEEFAPVDELLRARKGAGLTQAEVAERVAARVKQQKIEIGPIATG